MPSYEEILISEEQASAIAAAAYGITGQVKKLAGEIDLNYRIWNGKETCLLKISRPGADPCYLDFQQSILQFLEDKDILCPHLIPDLTGAWSTTITDQSGQERNVRLLSWIHGRLFSAVNPVTDALLESMGTIAGKLTKSLQGFDHPEAHRIFDWDNANATWTFDHLHLFTEPRKSIIRKFQHRFNAILPGYDILRKAVVHNDANDNNWIISDALDDPEALALVDFGDAVYTQVINDLAIAVAYAVMDKPDPVAAACRLVKGYHAQYPLKEEEIDMLYLLIAIRLVISVTKSAINKVKEPDNTYLLISEKQAWELLEKWAGISEAFATFRFRHACGFTPHPNEEAFKKWADMNVFLVKNMFPTLGVEQVEHIDLSLTSPLVSPYDSLDDSHLKFQRLHAKYPNKLFAGGYLESRIFYTTDAFRREGNSGFEHRTKHMGIDFWMEAGTPLHALMDGKVHTLVNNDYEKDYGPTLILEHETPGGLTFYTLHGHLSLTSLDFFRPGDMVKAGELIAHIGDLHENGGWPPHLHFQIILEHPGPEGNYNGVAFPSELDTWKSICPDPNLLFKEKALEPQKHPDREVQVAFRKKHLGKSLSLSYREPLDMARGQMQYLIDIHGQKYLDTVNNVPHVGHEHPRVVKAGQDQMAILNTNTRYLNDKIIDYSKALLEKLPPELYVIHFVNSGSEANELALRMARAFSGQKDMIAVEVGYHGNTSGCIDISSYKFDGKGGQGAPPHTHIVPIPDSFRGRYRGKLSETGAAYASHIQQQIEKVQRTGRGIAGFICEGIISCGGQIVLPDNYLKLAYDYVRQAGGVCISDEVQVGLGRVGHSFWAFELQGVVPDIVTMGKPIGNGHPLAAVACTREVAEAFANGMEYFNTFGGNPVSCAIGHEVLKVMEADKLQENALKVGNFLKEKLKSLGKKFPVIGEVRGEGLFLGFELIEDAALTPATAKTDYLANRMKELGILMSVDGPFHNVIKIKPPLCFTMENAKEVLFRLEQVLMEDFCACPGVGGS